MSDLSVLILAAGKGERMGAKRSKLLHLLSGNPLLSYPLKTARQLRPKKIVVLVGHKAQEIQKQFESEPLSWAIQSQQLGTAHAVLCGLKALKKQKGLLLILCGDVPFVETETLRKMQDLLLAEQASLVLLTTLLENSQGYGRIVRNELGNLVRIVEEKEASDVEKAIQEINAGIYLARIEDILKPLQGIKKSAVKGEYYLTDLIEELLKEGKKILSVAVPELEVMGINSQEQLAQADLILQNKIRQEWMRRGVTLIHPDSIRIEGDVELAPDVILHPGVILQGKTQVGAGAEIFPYSVIEDSHIGIGARIGPFAHIRPGSVVGDEAHVGNFVELKKTRLGKKAKANHLAYLGDAVIGDRSNVGAGTITCNYDGFKKYQTLVGDDSFIGSDTQLVAPVKLGKRSWVAAGTTVTKNVPEGALAVSRVEQMNVLNWKKKKR